MRQRWLERYETLAAECEAMARLATDQASQTTYGHLAVHYRRLAAGFRQAMAMHHAALAGMRP